VVQAVNHPHRRSDGAMHPDLHGTIATDDGARLMLRVQGRTLFGADGTGRQTLVVAFEAEDARYRWLNDLVCVYEDDVDRIAEEERVHRPRRPEDHPGPRLELTPADQAAQPTPECVGENTSLAQNATVVLPTKDQCSGTMAHATG